MFPAAAVFVLHTNRVWLSSKILAGSTAPGGKGNKSKGRSGGTCVALEQMVAGPKMDIRGVEMIFIISAGRVDLHICFFVSNGMRTGLSYRTTPNIRGVVGSLVYMLCARRSRIFLFYIQLLYLPFFFSPS